MSVLTRLALTASYVTSIGGLRKAASEDELRGLAKYLPSVGIIIGIALALIHLLLRELSCSRELEALIILLSWILITGGIHLDGLMDAADGLFSHRSPEKMLEIMKDSRVGNFGVISGLMIILSKYAALLSLPDKSTLTALLLIPAWARFAELYSIASFPYARENGMGKIWQESSSRSDLLPGAAAPGLFSLAIVFYFKSTNPALLIPLTVLPAIWLSHWIQKILKGQTGDTYGASVEFAEAAGLLLFSLFQKLL
ncbi:MAG: adenosylcobinamide-GDP ribazoletransferase [Candidatus Obscuribacterales bacterium]|nr:adenosylcobinamide-GDP ribazoletransferase [Candidatus Obscuribacterales bacterium]